MLFETKDYAGCVATLENQQLLNDDRFLLCQAYARSGKTDEARRLLKTLVSYASRYRDSATADPALKPLLDEIDRENAPAPSPGTTPAPANQPRTAPDARTPAVVR